MIPRITSIRQDDTHRLVPVAAESEESVLARLAGSATEVEALLELEGATNERLLGEASQLPGISPHELLFGIPYAHIVNAAFTHAHPLGSRFNGPERGAWYAGFQLQTAKAEIAYHKAIELREVDWPHTEIFTFSDYLADFRFEFHDIRGDAAYAACLQPDSYAASQRLAAKLLAAGSGGIVFPSVRYPAGTCIACFRPALVTNVRLGKTVRIEIRP